MALSLVQRLLHSFSAERAPPRHAAGAEVPPPAHHAFRAPWPRRLGAWLVSIPAAQSAGALADWRPSEARTLELSAARSAFRTVLDDIPVQQSDACLVSIRAARSMHELWHLRAEVFALVSRNRTQSEAARRLAVLDIHFPSRVRRGQRSGAHPREGQESVPPF
ncbi:MAG: hypothetical protein ACJ8G7_05810 [Rhizobacter sp.]